MIAVAAIGACFGVFALVLLVAILPKLMEADKELFRQSLLIAKMQADFDRGLQELHSHYEGQAQMQTGLWVPRTDPVTKKQSMERAPDIGASTDPLKELDISGFEDLIRQHEQRTALHA